MDRFAILDRISKSERAEIYIPFAIRYSLGEDGIEQEGSECPLEMACVYGDAVANDELASYWNVPIEVVIAFTRPWDKFVISDDELLHELRVRGTHRE